MNTCVQYSELGSELPPEFGVDVDFKWCSSRPKARAAFGSRDMFDIPLETR